MSKTCERILRSPRISLNLCTYIKIVHANLGGTYSKSSQNCAYLKKKSQTEEERNHEREKRDRKQTNIQNLKKKSPFPTNLN